MSAEPQKILCPCGSTISLKNKTQHEKSQKHLLAMTSAEVKNMPDVKAVMTTLSDKIGNQSDFEANTLQMLNYLVEAMEELKVGIGLGFKELGDMVEELKSGMIQLETMIDELYEEDDEEIKNIMGKEDKEK